MSHLSDLVLNRVKGFSDRKDAADFFEVTEAALTQWLNGTKPIPLSAVERVFDPAQPNVPDLDKYLVQGKQVAILLPWYKQTNPVTAFSVMSILDRAKMSVLLNFGDAFIAHTRNSLAGAFLKTELEWCLTVDDDMVLPCGKAKWFNAFTGFNFPDRFAGLNTVTRLLSHGKTLVGGLYFGRWKGGKPVYAEASDSVKEHEFARKAPYDLCKPTRWVGTGCMLIHRSVFLDIEREFPHLARNEAGDKGNWFTSSEHDLLAASQEALEVLSDQSTSAQSRADKAAGLIATAQAKSRRHSGLGMGEDVQFCVRATQAGHQPHVDMGLVCGHMGHHIFGPKKLP